MAHPYRIVGPALQAMEHWCDILILHLNDNVRGVVERNTMRYFLAIEAYLGAYSMPLAAQPEKSLRDWFAATERYRRQLHELEREQHLSMKRRELARQRAAPLKAH